MKIQYFRGGSGAVVFDADYTQYRNNASSLYGVNLTGTSVELPLNTFFTSIRNGGIRSKLRYLWIPYTSNFNVAMRIPQIYPLGQNNGLGILSVVQSITGFVGADYSLTTGAQGDGASKQVAATTNFNSIFSGATTYGQTVYSHTAGQDTGGGWEMGQFTGALPLPCFRFYLRDGSNLLRPQTLTNTSPGSAWPSMSNTDGSGLFSANRYGDGTHVVHRNGSTFGSPASYTNCNLTDQNLHLQTPYMFSRGSGATSPRRCSLFAWHEAFTLAEHQVLWSAFQTLCSSIGRSLP